MIKAHAQLKTTDGYLLCLFCVGFAKKRQQSDSEVLLCSSPTGLLNLENDDRNHSPKICKGLERSGQYIDSRKHQKTQKRPVSPFIHSMNVLVRK